MTRTHHPERAVEPGEDRENRSEARPPEPTHFLRQRIDVRAAEPWKTWRVNAVDATVFPR